MKNNNKKNDCNCGYWSQSSHTYSKDDVYYNCLKDVKSLADLDRLFQKMNTELEAEICERYCDIALNPTVTEAAKNVLLTTKDVIAKYPIGERALGELARNKTIPSTFHGNKRIFFEKDIEAYFLKRYNGRKGQTLE